MRNTRFPRLLAPLLSMALVLNVTAQIPSPDFLRQGEMELARGNYEGAITVYTRAIESSLSRSTAYCQRGIAKRCKGDLEGAIDDFNRTIEFAPTWGEAYGQRGCARILKGDLKGGLADYSHATELDPDKAGWFCMSRGRAKEDAGDLRGAIADYNQGIELDSKTARYYGIRGRYWLVFGHWHNALADYRKQCELSKAPQDYAHLYIWVSRAHLGEAEAADQELQDYLKKTKEPIVNRWAYHVGEFLLGQISEDGLLSAVRIGDPISQLNQRCEACYYAGLKRLLAGNKAGAADCFRECLATERTNFDEYRFAEAELKANGL